MDKQDYIEKLKKNPKKYKAAFAKESEVWGKVFSDDNRAEHVKVDRQAAQELGINLEDFTLAVAVEKWNLRPRHGLSLACGEGNAERNWISRGICERFHGIDVSEGAIETGETQGRGSKFSHHL